MKTQSFNLSTSTCGEQSLDSGCCQPHALNNVVPSDVGDLNPKCRSTCSIVLTACTDLYPTVGGDSMAAPQYKTTATCVVTPSPGEVLVNGMHILISMVTLICILDNWTIIKDDRNTRTVPVCKRRLLSDQ